MTVTLAASGSLASSFAASSIGSSISYNSISLSGMHFSDNHFVQSTAAAAAPVYNLRDGSAAGGVAISISPASAH